MDLEVRLLTIDYFSHNINKIASTFASALDIVGIWKCSEMKRKN